MTTAGLSNAHYSFVPYQSDASRGHGSQAVTTKRLLPIIADFFLENFTLGLIHPNPPGSFPWGQGNLFVAVSGESRRLRPGIQDY
jgi:hypothetical protein